MNNPNKNTDCVCVLGGGNFGTTLANLISLNGYQVNFWLRSEEQVRHINQKHRNFKYMPEVKLDPQIQATTNLKQAVSSARLLIFALPSKAFRTVFEQVVPYLSIQHMLVSTTKGVYKEDVSKNNFQLTSELMEEILHHRNHLPTNIPKGVISGPNLAKEIIAKQPTATVIASKSSTLSNYVKQVLTNDYFRVYINTDIKGVELGGALKNCYAIASGIIDALGMGDNTKSMLLTRALAEMNRFAVSFGASPLTFLGLTGIGDLIVTCLSPLSRNYNVGYQLGSGKPLDYALDHINGVSEGISSIKLVYQKARAHNINMPLLTAVYQIIYQNQPTRTTLINGLTHHQNDLDVEFDFTGQSIIHETHH